MHNVDLNLVKTVLKGLIISYPYKTTIKRLNNRYRDVEGDDIPFRNFGYNDLEAFLCSMPDTFTLFDDGHTFLVRVVTGTMSPNNTNETIQKQESKETSSSHTSNISNSKAEEEIERNVLSNGVNNLKIDREEAQPMHRQDKNDFKQSSRTSLDRKRIAKNNDQLDSVGTTLKSLRLRNYDEQNTSLSYEEKLGLIHKILRQRRQKRRNALWIRSNDLNKCEHKGQQKPMQALENQSVTTCDNRNQSKNPLGKVNINDQLKKDFEKSLVSLANSVISCDMRSIIDQNSLRERKRNRTHNCVRKSAYFAIQVGTPMTDVSKVSNNGQQERAYFLLCRRVNESLVADPAISNQETVYHNKNKPDSGLERDDIRNQSKSNKTLLDGFTFWRLETKKTVAKFAPRPKKISASVPANAMYCGFTFSNSYKPSRTIRDARLKIVINEIHSPYKFWFHFCATNLYLDMLSKMSTWYRDYKENEWQLPLDLLAPGRVCVAFHEDNWYRGRIVSWPTNNNKVKVFCVDYGNVYEVDVNRIKFLHQRFANIPTLAMRGSLTCVRPLDIHWCHSATKRFRDMTLALIVEAEVVDIDCAQTIYYLGINDKNVNISTYLVEQHLARYNRSCDLRRAYQKFPTFSMLESGEYPSFTELTQLLDKGFDYETIYDPLVQRLTTVSQDPKTGSPGVYNFPFNLITTNPFYADIIKQFQSKTATQRKFSR